MRLVCGRCVVAVVSLPRAVRSAVHLVCELQQRAALRLLPAARLVRQRQLRRLHGRDADARLPRSGRLRSAADSLLGLPRWAEQRRLPAARRLHRLRRPAGLPPARLAALLEMQSQRADTQAQRQHSPGCSPPPLSAAVLSSSLTAPRCCPLLRSAQPGHSSPQCPDPSACGVSAESSSSSPPAVIAPASSSSSSSAPLALVNCTGCVPGRSTAGCPNASACGGVESFPCIRCVSASVSASCPDPSWCGLAPACFGCVSGSGSGGGVGCPNLRACASSLPHCSGCINGLPTGGCPQPELCGFAPVQCSGCMAGMPMPGCPFPDVCPAAPAGGGGTGGAGADGCVASMLFQSSSSVCLLLASWYVSSPAQWLLLVLAVFALAAAREAVIAHRQHSQRMRRRSSRRRQLTTAPAPVPKQQLQQPMLAAGPHSSPLLRSQPTPRSATLLSQLSSCPLWPAVSAAVQYGLALSLAYLLMLMVMSFNVAVFLVVVLASAAAHLAVNAGYSLLWRTHAAAEAEAAAVGQPDAGNSALQPRWLQGSDDELKTAADPCCAQVEDWLDE